MVVSTLMIYFEFCNFRLCRQKVNAFFALPTMSMIFLRFVNGIISKFALLHFFQTFFAHVQQHLVSSFGYSSCYAFCELSSPWS